MIFPFRREQISRALIYGMQRSEFHGQSMIAGLEFEILLPIPL
jgi:hypothetical protein